MIIYIFGNLLNPSDSLPVQLLPRLQKEFQSITFVHADPSDNWWQGEKNIIIIDTVRGIHKVTLFDDLDLFQKQTMVTPHDYDLYIDLALMKKVGKIESVVIIGIPAIKSSNKIITVQLTAVLTKY